MPIVIKAFNYIILKLLFLISKTIFLFFINLNYLTPFIYKILFLYTLI